MANVIQQLGSNEVYVENGYADRRDYLESLEEEYGDVVYDLADLLGETEDFDGLVNSLADIDSF